MSSRTARCALVFAVAAYPGTPPGPGTTTATLEVPDGLRITGVPVS